MIRFALLARNLAGSRPVSVEWYCIRECLMGRGIDLRYGGERY